MNDLVVDRGPNPYLTNLTIKCNGRIMTNVQGDGMCDTTVIIIIMVWELDSDDSSIIIQVLREN